MTASMALQLGVLGGVALLVARSAGLLVKLVLAGVALLVVLGALGAVVDRSIPVEDAPPGVVTEPRTAPVPWTATQPRWRSSTRCPDALAPEAALVSLTARVDLLNGLRPGYAAWRGTLAIVRGENVAGICHDFVATQTASNVDRPVRSALGPQETPVWQGTSLLPDGWREMHAEQKAVHAAWLAGFRPIAVAASKPFCDDDRFPARQACDAWLPSTGAVLVSDRGAVWRW